MQRVKLNNLVKSKDLQIRAKEILEYDLSIGLEGMRDAFHEGENEGSKLPEATGAYPYKRHPNALRIYARCTQKLSNTANQSTTI